MKHFNKNNFKQSIKISNKLKLKLLKDCIEIEKIISIICDSLKNNGKILLCGNGGSASDAQHLAAEFMVRLRPSIKRNPIPAISLAMDISTITACSNDYSFTKIFSRNLKAIGNKNDILIVISTSGESKNILDVLKLSKIMNIKSVGFLGNKGGKAKKYCNYKIIVPSQDVARIQEIHIFLGHYIFEQVENSIIKKI
jgi:D-sedoheptulose 7-phosphate isomerase